MDRSTSRISEQLKQIGACPPALRWVDAMPEGFTLETLFHACPRPDWRLFLLARVGYRITALQRLVLELCKLPPEIDGYLAACITHQAAGLDSHLLADMPDTLLHRATNGVLLDTAEDARAQARALLCENLNYSYGPMSTAAALACAVQALTAHRGLGNDPAVISKRLRGLVTDWREVQSLFDEVARPKPLRFSPLFWGAPYPRADPEEDIRYNATNPEDRWTP